MTKNNQCKCKTSQNAKITAGEFTCLVYAGLALAMGLTLIGARLRQGWLERQQVSSQPCAKPVFELHRSR